jgi:glycerol-3-phosphate dehydrogenase subunit B
VSAAVQQPAGAPLAATQDSAPVQARYDLVVVGAGLAGMFAGLLAARRGLRTLVLARGNGGTHVGPGTIDVWGYRAGTRAALADSPMEELGRLDDPRHPLNIAGRPALEAALSEFQSICAESGYALAGSLDHNFHMPTAVGAVRPSCLVPESFAAGDVRGAGELTLADIPGFRDFYAALAAANLRAAGYPARALSLPLPRLPARRESFATDLARLLDQAAYRAEVAERWRPALQGVTRLGLPAVLGLRPPSTAWRELSERLGVALFEIPLMPPSVPGMRLFEILLSALQAAGGRLILGPRVRGWVGVDGRAAGVVVEQSRPRAYAARHVVLATGGMRHGGLHTPGPGQIYEGVFGLPVQSGPEWFSALYWEPHPYACFGLRVDDQFQPLGPDGQPVYANVFAVGGLLAGADRDIEGSREGIDLATSYQAVNQLTRPGTAAG